MKPLRITAPEAWSCWGWMVESVAGRHGITAEVLLSRRRDKEIARARHDLMACLYGSGCAFAEVGRLLGMDHTSVLYGVRKVLR